MSQNSLTTDYTTSDLGYSKTLTKTSLYSPVEELYSALPTSLTNVVTQSIKPTVIRSGEMTGNLSVVTGYLKSSNYYSGVNGWKIDAVGNLEANTAVIRGSMYADSGLIGGWVIDDDGLYYDGTGTPSIRTGETVGSGDDGVLIDSDGIKVYDSILGVVVNLPSDGSAPSFASGTIQNTIFEINTNAVLRTSETVGDGSADSAGVLINNSGIYACEANQLLANANIRINNFGNGYFKGSINASSITSTDITGGSITGAIITGGMIRTAATGQRTEIVNEGIKLVSSETAAAYGDSDFTYGNTARKYGTGVLGYINNSVYKVPFYVRSEQNVADIHLVNRSSEPTGAAEVGDLCVVNALLKICIQAGTPGGWVTVGPQEAESSESPTISPSASPSASLSASPSVSPSISPSESI
jgi:hypothetical protein